MKTYGKDRTYYSFNPQSGYPAGKDLYYECLRCGDVIHSLPIESMMCSCRNIAIDIEYGRVSIKDHSMVKTFSIVP
jgi:hypothetical protein